MQLSFHLLLGAFFALGHPRTWVLQQGLHCQAHHLFADGADGEHRLRGHGDAQVEIGIAPRLLTQNFAILDNCSYAACTTAEMWQTVQYVADIV